MGTGRPGELGAVSADAIGRDPGRPVVVDADGPVVCRVWPGRSGGPTIVCVHGVMSTSSSFTRIVGGLRLWADVVAPDLPGFGETPLAGRGGIKALSGALASVIDTCAGGRAVVVATSMGAPVAARLAGTSPERVAGLVMDSGYLPAYYAGWRAPAVGAGLLAEQFGKLGRSTAEAAMRSGLGVTPSEKALIAEDDFAAPEGVPPSSASERARAAARALGPLALGAVAPAVVRRRYQQVRCPVLLMHGGHDPNVPAPWAQAAARRFGWEAHVLPAVGHATHLACPQEWLHKVGDWLRRQRLVDA